MSLPILIMAGVAALAALAGALILIRPARSDRAVYVKRIAGTMTLSFALMLALFAAGLAWAAG